MLLQQPLPFTVLKPNKSYYSRLKAHLVATALTVYGIETSQNPANDTALVITLQQPLPFTVLKLCFIWINIHAPNKLQQPLPFTVLKPPIGDVKYFPYSGCNSPYRLRY